MRNALLLLCLLVAVTPAARAAPASVFIEDLTVTELRDLIAAGKTTVIIPIGGTEQNGPHMAIGKHNVRVKLLAGKIAAALGNALVAPVMPYVPEGRLDPPTGHMRFPGTITVPEAAFDTVIEYTARSFKQHGFATLLEGQGYPASEVGTHAGLADTSLMMALDPSLVRADRLKPGEGDNGDPSRASAALGMVGVELIVTKTVEAIKTAVARR